MRKYEAFYNGKSTIIEAESLWDAKVAAIRFFKVPGSKQSLVAVQFKDSDNYKYR